MDSVVFSKQVGRGLAGCEVARDCLFRGWPVFSFFAQCGPQVFGASCRDVPLL